MKLIKFINMHGNEAWVNPTHVVGVTCKWSTKELEHLTEIWCVDGRLFTVTENINEVVNKLTYIN